MSNADRTGFDHHRATAAIAGGGLGVLRRCDDRHEPPALGFADRPGAPLDMVEDLS